MDRLISINGKICDAKDAKISVYDRSFLFGDSIYEVVRSYEGTFFLMEEHLDRLWESAAKIMLIPDFTREELKKDIKELAAAAGFENVYIRIVISRGEVDEVNIDPTKTITKNNRILYAHKLNPYPQDWYNKGVNFVIANTQRNTKESMDPSIKSGNYLNNVMAVSEAKKKGAFDAFMFNREGNLTEGTTNNAWIVKDGVVLTPPLNAGILRGITREKLIELMKANNIDFKIKHISRDELLSAEECFFTSSTKEIVPITSIDGRAIDKGVPGDITKKLMKLMKDYISQYKQDNGRSF